MTPEQKERLESIQNEVLKVILEQGLSFEDTNAENISMVIMILIFVNSKALGSIFAYGNTPTASENKLIDDMAKEIKINSQELKLQLKEVMNFAKENCSEKVH